MHDPMPGRMLKSSVVAGMLLFVSQWLGWPQFPHEVYVLLIIVIASVFITGLLTLGLLVETNVYADPHRHVCSKCGRHER